MIKSQLLSMNTDEDLISAETHYRTLLKSNPESASLAAALGSVLLSSKKYAEVALLFRKANDLDPQNANYVYSLAQCYYRQLEYEEALKFYNKAIFLQPKMLAAYHSIAAIYSLLRDYQKAREYLRKALEIKPNSSVAYFNLGILLCELGEIEQGCAALRESIELDSTVSLAHSALLFYLHYQPHVAQALLYKEHRAWQKIHAIKPNDWIKHKNNKDPDRRLKIAYISPDMHIHSVAFFFIAILKSHNKNQYETFCYSDGEKKDDMSRTLQTLAEHWRDISHSSDEYVLQKIKEDEIDILIDLTGHTGDNRLKALSCKPAPVQVTYLGYPNTTGLDSIDYRLTDKWVDPPEENGRYHAEKLVYLADGFLCYQAATNLPDVTPAPVNINQHITFGSFNNLAKINNNTIYLWASVMNALPGSCIVLKAKGLTDAVAQQRLRQQFSQYGISSEYINILNYENTINDHLINYGLIDIALDTFPYNGTATTCEALWMGVPVITLQGDMHVSRVGESIMQQANLPDLIAKTSKDYIDIAVGLAGNLDLLNHLRNNLRPHIAASKLTDAQGFIVHLEHAYRKMWQDYCTHQSQRS